jgi:hypothetical protein
MLCYIRETMSNDSLRGMLKWPLIIAGLAVVLRVVLEQLQVQVAASNLVSVVALHLVICPVYFAFRIGRSGVEHPYRLLLKSVTLYAVLARALIIPTYWLAYIYQWQVPRFLVTRGGVVGPDVSPFRAYVGVPLVLSLMWVIGSLVVGGILGSIVLAATRRMPRTAA